MKKHEKKIISILIIVVVICIISIIYLLLTREKPDYAPIKIDPNAVEINDKKSKKLKSAKGGGAVALSYDSNAKIDNKTKNITLQFKNPSQSNQNMTLKVVVEKNTIAESALLPPGYTIYNLKLKDNVLLEKGDYKGEFVVNYYDEKNMEKASLDTVIPIKIKVQ